MENSEQIDFSKYLNKENVEQILMKHVKSNKETIKRYSIKNASDKMLGFLCDYWRLEVETSTNRVFKYFLKVIPITNVAKAEIVKELNLIEKELFFYDVIKESIRIPGLQPWSANLVTGLENGIVFEDLNALGYKHRDKFRRFDMAHTLAALKALARFHSSSIVFEEKKSKEHGVAYSLNDEFGKYLDKAGYEVSDPWYEQCMLGALEAVKTFSQFNKEEITLIEQRWLEVWSSAVALSDPSIEHRNVVCHRDLWNNNIMFHYETDNENRDNCVFVDFQAARYMPPAGDVMLLLYCNLEPNFREANLEFFLNFYIDELNKIIINNEVEAISKDKFIESAREQRKWGVVIAACLMPISWLDDNETSEIFGDANQFDDIVTKNKASFIINRMRADSEYKEKVLEIFEEIAVRYCLPNDNRT